MVTFQKKYSSGFLQGHRMWCQVGKLPQIPFVILLIGWHLVCPRNLIPLECLDVFPCRCSIKSFHAYCAANKVIKYSVYWYQHYKEIQKVHLINLPKLHHRFPIMHCGSWKYSISSKIRIFQMQDAIEMGISLPNTEKFSPYFENIKFGHQNILLMTNPPLINKSSLD